MLRPDDVRGAREAADYHQPTVALISIENTHMSACGAPWTIEGLQAVADAAGPVPIHMDGARLFNAEAATGVTAAEWTAPVTTVMCCLSKGLCAPVGSLLACGEDVIADGAPGAQATGRRYAPGGCARRARAVALRDMVGRLPEDHARAARLAEAVAERWPACGFDPAAVRTNIVTFSHDATDKLRAHLAANGVLADAIAPGVMRLVTHHDVDDAAVGRAVVALGDAP